MAGRDGEKQSGTGTTQAATATQVGTGGKAHLTGTSPVIFVFFPLISSTYSFFFFMVASFPRRATIVGAGWDVTNACVKSNAGRGNKGGAGRDVMGPERASRDRAGGQANGKRR